MTAVPFAWTGWGDPLPVMPAAFTVWSYRSPDSAAALLTPGYFDALLGLLALQPGDWIVGGARDLYVADVHPSIVVEPLDDWFDRACSCRPVRH